ncbi:SDR family NAD(P)-dependent oxidoreductase [Caulobacter segnis]|uniref:SDR family NAD(P)-dependent oxidoreductase n=1 Tax=Caulobacter segnis TaxID=88688 RepID=UPI001CBCE078|nr:SDR family NAD(P)-dependent oxidoreductase [Caulobacter segnis]UAL10190.1 SDR family NAD(P)-dependent oxidoreductase [Caulobacter segnis]
MDTVPGASSFSGKVAVITGAASGIGLALALEAARRGMDVALGDIGEEGLAKAKEAVEALGVRAVAIRTDVSKLVDVQALHDGAALALGDPWLVINNAGITKLALTWDHTEADWKRMFDINVGGVINGLLAFLPGLRARGEGHIVNTASAAGLLTIPAASAYVASKHAVVGLSETLYRELIASRSGVGASVLCPALVKTNILGAAAPAGGKASEINSPHALEPEEVARQVFEAVAAKRFWILTHRAHMEPYIRARAEQMVTETNPNAASVDPDVSKTSSLATGVDFTTWPDA